MNKGAVTAGVLIALALLANQSNAQSNGGGSGHATTTGATVPTCTLDPSSAPVEIAASDLLARIKSLDPNVFCTKWRVVIGDYAALHGLGDVLANVYLLITMTPNDAPAADKEKVDRLVTWFNACEWAVFPSGYGQLRAKMEPIEAEMAYSRSFGFHASSNHPQAYPGRYEELAAQQAAYQQQLNQWNALYNGFPIFERWKKVTRNYPGINVGYGEVRNDAMYLQGVSQFTRDMAPENVYPALRWQDYQHQLGMLETTRQWLVRAYHRGIFCQDLSKQLKLPGEPPEHWIAPARGNPGNDPLWFYQSCWDQQGRTVPGVGSGWAEPKSVADLRCRDITDWRLFTLHAKHILHEYALARFLQLFYMRGINPQGGEKAVTDMLQSGLAIAGGVAIAAATASNPVGWIGAALLFLGHSIKLAMSLDGLKRLEVGVREAAKKHAIDAMARFGLKTADLSGWKYGINRPGPGQVIRSSPTRDAEIADPWRHFYTGEAPQQPLLWLNPPFDMPYFTAYYLGNTQARTFRVIEKHDYPRWELQDQKQPRL